MTAEQVMNKEKATNKEFNLLNRLKISKPSIHTLHNIFGDYRTDFDLFGCKIQDDLYLKEASNP